MTPRALAGLCASHRGARALSGAIAAREEQFSHFGILQPRGVTFTYNRSTVPCDDCDDRCLVAAARRAVASRGFQVRSVNAHSDHNVIVARYDKSCAIAG